MGYRVRLLWRACAAIGLLAACGGGGGHGPGPADGGPADGAADAPGSMPDACTPNTSTLPYAGQIVLTYTSVPSETYTATAAFTTTPACAATTPCTMRVDQCCYVAPDAGQAAGGTAVGAGALTIDTMTTMAPAGAMYTPVANPPTTSLRWYGEANIVIDAAGDAVHAFETQVTAAPAPTGVSPVFSSSTPMSIPRTADFDVSWAQGNGGVTLELTAASGGSSHGYIRCSASPDGGFMNVPHALLQKFSSGDTGTITLTRTYGSVDSPDNASVYTQTNGLQTGVTTYP